MVMFAGRSFTFTTAITRKPALSVTRGLRDGDGPDPDAANFSKQHEHYLSALKTAGADVVVLPALEAFPDSVFVEDSALCLKEVAILLRPGVRSRRGESALIRTALENRFSNIIELSGNGSVDGGDVLLSDKDAFIGLSARTNQAGFDALASIVGKYGYRPVRVDTPASILHFKTECGLLDSETIFATTNLASIGCFEGYQVLIAPDGEEAAANIVRFNDYVLISKGYPKSEALLKSHGYKLLVVDSSEGAKVDGGLSCMSLRF